MTPNTDTKTETMPGESAAANGSQLERVLAAVMNEPSPYAAMRAALRIIVDNFEKLNAMECTTHCGKCIKCIAIEALEVADAKGESPSKLSLDDVIGYLRASEDMHRKFSGQDGADKSYERGRFSAFRDAREFIAANDALCESAGRNKTHESKGDVAAPSDSQQQMAMPPSVGNAHNNNTKDK